MDKKKGIGQMWILIFVGNYWSNTKIALTKLLILENTQMVEKMANFKRKKENPIRWIKDLFYVY